MVGTMIVMAYAAVETVGALTAMQMAAAFAINFAVSMIVTRVFGQDQQGPQDNGVRQQVPPSNANAIPVVYGDAYLGGTFVDAVLSTDQKVMYYVLAVSCISPDGQFGFDTEDMYYGDRLITFDDIQDAKVASLTDEAGNVDTKIGTEGALWIYLYKSDASGTITPLNSSYLPSDGQVMGATTIPVDQRWPSSGRQMNGIAFAIVRLHYNTDAGTTSLSPITFKARHHLNGTGYAIPGDVWYDYITNSQYGGAVDSAFVDSASATALNAYSNEVITFDTYTGSPSTQPRYRINGVLDAGQPVLSNIDKIMTCCDSWMAYNAASGKWSVVINKAETPDYSFNDDNIIGEIRVSATDITQSINQVEAKFPNKDNRDQPDYVNLATPSILLYPNEPVNKYSVSYDLANNSVQAQYLANRILEQAREDLIVSFSTTYYGIQVDAGAVVSVTNSDYGWSDKLFRVVKVNEASLPDGSLGARLEMTEYSAAVYDNFNITEYTPVPNSGLPSPSYFSSLSAPTISATRPTASIPSFDVQVTIPSTGRVTWSNLFYTTTPSDVASWKLLASASTANNEPVTPGSTYTFANQVLPIGDYYFSFIVGNNISTSPRSPTSSVLNWNPTGMVGPTGPTGTGPTGPTGSLGPTGSSGIQTATAYLYQWATATPTGPSGSSTYTWATGVNSSYTGGDGWDTTVPANPGIGGLYLFVASKPLTAAAATATTTVSWTSGVTVYASTGNGDDGVQQGVASVYRWATTIPTISGTSTFTWATGAVSSPPTGWFTTISDTGSAGQTLWKASVTLTDAVSVTTSTVSWSGASIVPFGYSGSTGAVGRTAYTATSLTLNTTPSSYTVSGDTVPASSSWGTGVTWTTAVPTLSAGQQVWQTDGIYNPTNNQTIWGVPYLSALKVGNLSAISTNTGSLTVSGNVTIGSYGNIRGGQTAYNTGTGFFLGYSGGTYKFSIGSSTVNMTWDGTAFTVTGGVIQTGTSGARLVMGGPSYAQALIGYNSGGGITMGFNANNGQIYASNYAGGIAADFDNVSASPAIRGTNGGTGTNNGCGVYGGSIGGFGGEFYGSTSRGTVYIDPLPSLPSGILTGGMCVYNNHLYFCNGTSWVMVI